MQAEPTALATRILRSIERVLGAKPPRIASVQLGPRVDVEKTTGAHGPRARYRNGGLSGALYDPYGQTRVRRYGDYREMREEVPELDRSLSVLVDFVFGGSDDATELTSFGLTYAPGARNEVLRVHEQTVADLDLHKTIRSVAHEGLWLGDSPTELLFDDAGMRAQRPITPERFSVQEADGFLDGYTVAGTSIGSEVRALLPYQVLHYAPNAPRGSFYGRSLWASGRGVRQAHEAVADVMLILALQRAGGDDKILWPFPDDIDDQAMWDWITEQQNRLEEVYYDTSGELRKRIATQLETTTRFLPYKVDAELKDSLKPTPYTRAAANLSQLVEVLRYYQERFFITTGVPAALVGLERNVNARSTLEQQGIHFALSVRFRQREVAELLVDVFTRALLAAGIVPIPGEYQVTMAPPSQLDERMRAEVVEIKSRSVKTLVDAGAPLRFALRTAYGLAEEDLDRIDESVQARRLRGGERVDPGDAMAAVMDGVGRLRSPLAVDGASRAHLPGNQIPQAA